MIFSNRNKDFSQQGWDPVIGPFFNRGLMLLDFDEHMFHRRIMQEAFTRTRLAGYVEQVDTVASQVIANDWVANDARFLLYPAMKELTLDIASMVFMGHEPGTDHELVTKVNNAFTTTTRAGNAIIRTGVPPFTWWRGLQARKLLEDYFEARVKERRGKEGSDLLTVLCHTEDEDGNKFSDDDIVNHMIFLMMAAHDTSTSTATTMSYYLAANPEWQDRCRDESDRLGDGPLDIESLEKLETLDLVMNESIRMVTARAVGDAPDRARHRTARLLHSQGHQRHRLSGHEPPAARSSTPIRTSSTRTASPSRATSTRSTATRSRRSAAARTSASAWCSASSRSRRSCTGCCASTGSSCRSRVTSQAGTTAACRSRWTACRSCCARCADALAPKRNSRSSKTRELAPGNSVSAFRPRSAAGSRRR